MGPETIRSLLARFEPDETSLLVWLAPRVSDAMLREIAECDYGFDADLNFERLVEIRDSAEVAVPLEWNPKEVLELTRWSEPRDPELWHAAPAAVGRYRSDHLKRAFACAALIRAGADEGVIRFDRERKRVDRAAGRERRRDRDGGRWAGPARPGACGSDEDARRA